MVRSSPQTERLVEVVELLAGSGSAGRTLAEVARHLGVDKATCYPMLVELTRVGWLVRNPRVKSYHLGPGLVGIGRAAETAFDVLEVARIRAMELAEDHGVSTLIVARSQPDLVIADVVTRAVSARRRGADAIGLRAGDTIALQPPLGSTLVAWSEEAVIEDWMSRAPEGPEAADHLNAALAFVRAHGFAVEQFVPDPRTLGEIVETTVGELRGSKRADQLIRDQLARFGSDALLSEVDDSDAYYPISINTPIFGMDGEVTHALCMVDIEGPVSGAEVMALGRAVVAKATQISLDAGVR